MPLVASQSVKRTVLLISMCVVFVGIGILMVLSPRDGSMDAFGGWLSIGCGIVGGVPLLWKLVVRPLRLVIDSNGIEWSDYSDETIPWSAISDINVLAVGVSRFVSVFLVDSARYPSRWTRRGWGPSLNTRLYKADMFVTTILLNRSLEDILDAVDQYWPPR